MSVVLLVSPYRNQVIQLYRQILKLGRNWTSSTNKHQDTITEREFILTEAKTLFRKNQHLTDPKVISDYIHEAQARLDLGKVSCNIQNIMCVFLRINVHVVYSLYD